METFEVGKYYQHSAGRYISIVGEVKTDCWGDTLVIEEADHTGHAISCIDKDSERKENWTEIGRAEWMKNFDPKDNKKILDEVLNKVII